MKPTDPSDPALDETVADSSEELYCPSCDKSYATGTRSCPDDGTALVALRDAAINVIGRVIDGRYEVKSLLGKGGMGTVYRGLQVSIGRPVAIKLVHPHLARDRIVAKRFLRESKLCSRLSHPNTVTLLDFGQTEDGMLFMVMELLEGRTLDAILRGEGALEISRALRITGQVADALEAAHALDIVHRDLKPSNVVVVEDASGRERIRVLDFGLARSLAGDDTTVTKSDMLIGTPRYIPPELARGGRVDTRADLYSLGVILYETLTGAPPFEAATIHAMLYAHLNEEPPPLPESVPAGVRKLVGELLEKDPADRPASASEVSRRLTELRREQTGESSVAATVDRPVREAPAPGSRSRLPLLLAGLVAAAGAVALFLLLRGGDPAPPDATPAVAPADAAAAPTTAATPIDAAPLMTVPVDAAPPATVTATIETDPRGARVLRDGATVCRSTPCELALPANSGAVTLRLERRGHRSREVEVSTDDSRSYRFELKRRRSKPPADDPPAKPPEDFLSP